jgi:hypothetical protein
LNPMIPFLKNPGFPFVSSHRLRVLGPIEVKPFEGSISRAGFFGYAGSIPGRRNAEIKNVRPPPCRSTKRSPICRKGLNPS